MNVQATAKFSVLGAAEATLPHPVRQKECSPPQKKTFITDSSRGNAMDITERNVEIALLYGVPPDDTVEESEHSVVPFLGDVDFQAPTQRHDDSAVPNEKNDAAGVLSNMDDSQTSLLKRLIALWSDEALSSLPLEHGIFDQDEAFWKAFVMSLPSSRRVSACVNALYQIERRFPSLYTAWQTHLGSLKVETKESLPTKPLEIQGTTQDSPFETMALSEEKDTIQEPKQAAPIESLVEEPDQSREHLIETSNHNSERALAEQWMNANLCSLPIQNAVNLNMAAFLDALTVSRLSLNSLRAMNALYGLERIEPQRYRHLLRQVQKHSTMAVPTKATTEMNSEISPPMQSPPVVESPISESVDTKPREPLGEQVATASCTTELALAEQWMDPNLRSLPIQNVCNLNMEVFLEALSASRLSPDSLHAMNALYGLERTESHRYKQLLRQVQRHNAMATHTSKVIATLVDQDSKVLETPAAMAPTDENVQQSEIAPVNKTNDTSQSLPKEIATTSSGDMVDKSTTTNQKPTITNYTPSESAPKDSPQNDAASFTTSETAMTSLMGQHGNDEAILVSSTSSLKSTDSSVDVVPLKVAGNPKVTAPSYSEIISKAASDDLVLFQERTTTTQRRAVVPIKRSEPKSRFVPSLSAVVSVNDSKPISAPKDKELFETTSIVVLMTSNPAHPEIARQQTIVENTLDEEGCVTYMKLDGADRVHKWKRNTLFELSGSHGEYPQIFSRDSSGKLSFWGTFETFMKAKKRGSLLDELMQGTPGQDASDEKTETTLLVLFSGQSLKQYVKMNQSKALSILDAHGIPYETLDGADPVNKDRRSQLFALSGSSGKYPQFFTIGPDQEVSHWGDWDDFESSNELGSLAKEFGVAAIGTADVVQDASPTSIPNIDGSLVCLISGQSIETNVRNRQEKSFAIFKDQSIPYEIIDGAEKSNKTLRKKLFGISGLHAIYPQFFLKKNNKYLSLGGWDKLEECNDDGNIAAFLTPVTGEPEAADDGDDKATTNEQATQPRAMSSQSFKRTLSTQPTPKMDNLSHKEIAASNTKKETMTAKSSKSKSEITFYGATSFVAKHALDYMIQVSLTLPGVRNITLAGRNAEKLERLRKTVADKMSNMRTIHPQALGRCVFDVFVADSSDSAGLATMASRTKVVASFAGPFANYSEKVVEACAKVGTDYVDITGEVSWASTTRLKYSSLSEASGARIISFCGFDSVPSDMAIYAAAESMKRKLGRATDIVSGTTWHYAQGSANGGTIQTVVEMPLNISKCFFRWVPFLVDDPLALTHPSVRLDADNVQRKNQLAMAEWMNQLLTFESFLGMGVSAPFFMAPVNAKVVNASAVALSYGLNFVYRERFLPLGFRMTKAMSILSFIPALVVQLGVLFLGLVLKFPIVGKIISGIFFPAGSGMSDQMCRNGASEVYAEVVSSEKNGKVDRVYCAMKFEGDPGNWVTAQCICECALALVLDRSKLPKRSTDGFGTPAELLGSVLLERLEKTKVRPVDVKTYVQKSAAPNERVLCHFQ